MAKIPKLIGLSKTEERTINRRLKKIGDWSATDVEWKGWIQRLIMDDIGNY